MVTRFVNQVSPDHTEFHQSTFLPVYLSKSFKANKQDFAKKEISQPF